MDFQIALHQIERRKRFDRSISAGTIRYLAGRHVWCTALVAWVSAVASAVATSLTAFIPNRINYGHTDCLLKPF